MNDEYLWDPSAATDTDLASLEDLLCVYRYEHRPLERAREAVPSPARRLPWVEIAVMLAAAAVVLGLFAFLRSGPPPTPPAEAPAAAPPAPQPETGPTPTPALEPTRPDSVETPAPTKDAQDEGDSKDRSASPDLKDPFAADSPAEKPVPKRKKKGESSPDLKNPFASAQDDTRSEPKPTKKGKKGEKGTKPGKLLNPFDESGSPDLSDPFSGTGSATPSNSQDLRDPMQRD